MGVLALLEPVPAAEEAGPRGEAEQLAQESVERRFLPLLSDPDRDSITGRTRQEMLEEAVQHFLQMRREHPDRFWSIVRMQTGEEASRALYAQANALAARGDLLGAILGWEQVVTVFPGSTVADEALLRLADQQAAREDYVSAMQGLERVIDLRMESSFDAELEMKRLLDDLDARVEEARARVPGGQVRLDHTIERLDLDAARRYTEWMGGHDRVDEIAWRIGLETSGDVLRVAKNLGADDVSVDRLARLIPLEERKRVIAADVAGRHPGASREEMDRLLADRFRKNLDRVENLAPAHQLCLYLLADALRRLTLPAETRGTAGETVILRTDQARRLEGGGPGRAEHRSPLARHPGRVETVAPGPEEDAWVLALLFRIADVDGNGRLSELRDDEGVWRPHRRAVESDMVNAVWKPLDDDNHPEVEELFRASGFTEQGLLASLARACSDPGGNLDPDASERIVTGLLAGSGSRATWAPGGALPAGGDLDELRLYLYRLNATRLPGESLEALLRTLYLHDAPGRWISPDYLARLLRREEELRTSLGSLGERQGDLLLFVSDGSEAGSEKFERALALDREWNEVQGEILAASLEDAFLTDLESRGFLFTRRDRARIAQTIRWEDLGSVAFLFDGNGGFLGLDHVVALHEMEKAYGAQGAHSWVSGVGLDLAGLAPGGSTGYQWKKELPKGTLRYRIGAVGASAGVADAQGVSFTWPTEKQNRLEAGADVSFLRGFGAHAFLGWTRDLTTKLRREVAAVFAELEGARNDRALFASMIFDPGRVETAGIREFLHSLGLSRESVLASETAWRTLLDSYEFEKRRQMSLTDHRARRVRFAGLGVDAGFAGGTVYLLAGPKIAVKDWRFFSILREEGTLEIQSEEAYRRRMVIRAPLEPRGGRREDLYVSADPSVDEAGGLQMDFSPPVLEARRIPAKNAPGTGMLAALGGASELPPSPPPEPGAAQIVRLNEALEHGGSPLRVEGVTGEPHRFSLRFEGLSKHLSQTARIYVSENDGLGLFLAEDGTPVLVAPAGLSEVNLDWFDLGRAVAHPGDAEESYRLVVSRGEESKSHGVVRGSGLYARVDLVGGRLVSSAIIPTGYESPGGEPILQGNLLPHPDPVRLASIEDTFRSEESERSRAESRLLGKPLLSADFPAASGPAAPDPAFLESLQATRPEEIRRFKERNLRHYEETGTPFAPLEPVNVAYIQERANATGLPPLRGDALLAAYFSLSNRGLHRVDDRPVPEQMKALRARAGTAFRPESGPFRGSRIDPGTRALLDAAGVDTDGALAEIATAIEEMIRWTEKEGAFATTPLPPGTTILTDSSTAGLRGVQRYKAPQGTEGHLARSWGLQSNTGRFIALTGIAPLLPGIHAQVMGRLGLPPSDTEPHYREVFVPAFLDAVRDPVSDTRLVAVLPGGRQVRVVFDGPQNAGALTICKNGTLFPAAFRVEVEEVAEAWLARQPLVRVGFAESSLQFFGETWAGYRNLSLLFGAPLEGSHHHHDEDDRKGRAVPDNREPPPEPPPGEDRSGNGTPDSGGRPKPPEPPPGPNPPPDARPTRPPKGPGVPPVPDLPDRPVD